jgi:hypothetical protein
VYLDLGSSKEQVQVFAPGEKDLSKSSIMSCALGDGANMKLAMRKLDNLGYIKSYGGVQNYPERLRRLKNKLQSLTTIALLE